MLLTVVGRELEGNRLGQVNTGIMMNFCRFKSKVFSMYFLTPWKSMEPPIGINDSQAINLIIGSIN